MASNPPPPFDLFEGTPLKGYLEQI
jgi:hypothetical protein